MTQYEFMMPLTFLCEMNTVVKLVVCMFSFDLHALLQDMTNEHTSTISMGN